MHTPHVQQTAGAFQDVVTASLHLDKQIPVIMQVMETQWTQVTLMMISDCMKASRHIDSRSGLQRAL